MTTIEKAALLVVVLAVLGGLGSFCVAQVSNCDQFNNHDDFLACRQIEEVFGD